MLGAGGEDRFGVELRRRTGAPAALNEAAGAVAEHVGVRVRDGAEHPAGHGALVRAKLRMHAGDHDIQPVQHLRGLVQGAVLEDVDLDAPQQAEAAAVGVDPRDDAELLRQPLGTEPVGDLEVG